MPRESISMNDPEVRKFLAAQEWMLLVTLGPDGMPAAEIVPSVVDGETLYFGLRDASDADLNIRRDPRVCCANDENPSYYEIRGATVHGHAVPVNDEGLQRRLGGKALQVYALVLDDVMSFDFAKIQNKF